MTDMSMSSLRISTTNLLSLFQANIETGCLEMPMLKVAQDPLSDTAEVQSLRLLRHAPHHESTIKRIVGIADEPASEWAREGFRSDFLNPDGRFVSLMSIPGFEGNMVICGYIQRSTNAIAALSAFMTSDGDKKLGANQVTHLTYLFSLPAHPEGIRSYLAKHGSGQDPETIAKHIVASGQFGRRKSLEEELYRVEETRVEKGNERKASHAFGVERAIVLGALYCNHDIFPAQFKNIRSRLSVSRFEDRVEDRIEIVADCPDTRRRGAMPLKPFLAGLWGEVRKLCSIAG